MFRGTPAPRPMLSVRDLPPGHPAHAASGARVGQYANGMVPGAVNQPPPGAYPAACGIGVGGGPGCETGNKVVVGIDTTPETLWSRISSLPTGQTANGWSTSVVTTGSPSLYFTFTSKCNWIPEWLYLEPVVTASGAALPVDVLSIYACTVDGQNLLGGRDEATNLIPSTLFYEPRANCCPLVNLGVIPAMASLIIGVRVRATTAGTMYGAAGGRAA